MEQKPIGMLIELRAPDWLTKEGKIRQRDASNYIKACEDGVFGALGVDDKVIWEISVKKVHADEKCTHVTLYTLDELRLPHTD